jgi:hypothetical protein
MKYNDNKVRRWVGGCGGGKEVVRVGVEESLV